MSDSPRPATPPDVEPSVPRNPQELADWARKQAGLIRDNLTDRDIIRIAKKIAAELHRHALRCLSARDAKHLEYEDRHWGTGNTRVVGDILELLDRAVQLTAPAATPALVPSDSHRQTTPVAPSPQDSRQLQVNAFVRRFRQAAEEFRTFPDDGRIVMKKHGRDAKGSECEVITGVRSASRLEEKCGIWMIEAHNLGLIPTAQVEIIQKIEEHARPCPQGEPLPPGVAARYERCPSNLFAAVRGGGQVVGRLTEHDGRHTLEPVDAPRYGNTWDNSGRFVTVIDGQPVEVFTDRSKRYAETGGLMTNAVPGHLQLSPMQRNAETCEWIADLIESAPAKGGDAPTTPVEPPPVGSQTPVPTNSPKRSTVPGEGRARLISALTKHHKYADGGCLNLEPIGCTELAKAAGLGKTGKSTASEFFKKEFGGYDKYKVTCQDSGTLIAALKLLNGEFSPHHLFDRKPPSENDRDDE